MRILHYNDEEKQLHSYLAEHGHANTVLSMADDPFEVAGRQRFEAAFVGLHPNGLQLIQALRRNHPGCLVTIITKDRDTRMAVEAMKGGAFDYLLTPLDFDQVERTCIHMTRQYEQQRRQRRLEDRLAEVNNLTQFVGHSSQSQQIRQRIEQTAASDVPVLILGQSGTGRRHIARLIHHRCARHDQPIIELHPTTTLPVSLTKAGSLLIDDVQDFNAQGQTHLFHMIESSDARAFATADADLPARVEAGRFDRRLYDQLNVLRIDVPSLSYRRDDIAPLVQHFLTLHAEREGRSALHVTPAVWRWLEQYAWPGQVREIENICRRAIVMSDGQTFDDDVLDASAPQPLSEAATQAPQVESMGQMRAIKTAIEKRLIEQTLIDAQNNLSATARTLGISRTTLYEKIKSLNITR